MDDLSWNTVLGIFIFNDGLGETMSLKRWLYKGGHPNTLAKVLNKGWAILHSLGISPNYLVTLEVVGRQSGKLISFPLVMMVMNGERYLLSMLGEEANWVQNIKAAGEKQPCGMASAKK